MSLCDDEMERKAGIVVRRAAAAVAYKEKATEKAESYSNSSMVIGKGSGEGSSSKEL